MHRPRRLLVAAAVLAASMGIILWNTAAQETPQSVGVSDAKRDPAFTGLPLQVHGIVEEGSIVYNGTVVESFVLADAHERLLVLYGQRPPDAFGPKDVVVHGRIGALEDGTVVLQADSIHVGCASKY